MSFVKKKKTLVTWQVCEMLSDISFLRAEVFNFFSLFFLVFEEKSPYRVGRHVENVTWLSLLFLLRFFLFYLNSAREKNLSPNFGVMFFFGLGRFSIYWVVGLLKSFLTRGP